MTFELHATADALEAFDGTPAVDLKTTLPRRQER